MLGIPLQRLMQTISQLRSALCYGHDALLLLTRQRMLMLLDCSCETVTSYTEFRERLRSGTPRIIVLCQSLTGEECSQASHFAAQHCPESRLVVMFTRLEKCVPQEAYGLMATHAGPKVFSRIMSELLGEQLLPESPLAGLA